MPHSKIGLRSAARKSDEPIGRSGLVLAAMAAGGAGARFNAVQIENLLLLVDREIADDIGGPHFDFEPYPHGPYDAAVLATVERLAAEGRAVIDGSGPYWVCLATNEGFLEGRAELDRMTHRASRFVEAAAKWVLSQPFRPLLAAIYRRYPDMAAKSRIPLAALRDNGSSPQDQIHPFLRGMAQSIGILRRRGEPEFEDPNPIELDWKAVGDDLRLAMERVLGAPEAS